MLPSAAAFDLSNADFWKITADERAKHNASFAQQSPVNGFITGEQAKNFFMKSGLPTNVLGVIWNLADLNKDGKLDKKEFSIACFLIKRVLTTGQNGAPNPAILPAVLPPSLLIEPPLTGQTSAGNLASLVPTSTPMAAISTSSLVAAAFAPLTASTTTTTQQAAPPLNLFPASFSSSNLLASTNLATLPAATSGGATMMAPILFPPSSGFGAPLAATTTVPSSLPGAVVTPLSMNLPNPVTQIPSTSRARYTQMFQSNDPGMTGFITGQQAKTLLVQSNLPQATLAQIWNLADYDKDGKLSLDEFILAMHFCDFAKAGNILPSVLPLELQPQQQQRSRSTSQLLPATATPIDLSSGGLSNLAMLNASLSSTAATAVPLPGLVTGPLTIGGDAAGGGGGDSSPSSKAKQQQQQAAANNAPIIPATFEDKRRENFDRGNAVLEAKRQMLREAEEREKREREEKERAEMEKRQKLKDEQERRRMAELEKQMERQRLLDMQREEERRKAFEKQEAARNELIRQQRLEWERQKKQELEAQKLKLQEQLSTLKAKDKNLEYDMQALNEKTTTYKNKIADTQTNLIDLDTRLETTQRASVVKQAEYESVEKQIREYSQNLSRLGQERLLLSEKQKNLNQDNPFAEEYRNDSMSLKMKQQLVQQLKAELEQIESQINATRTQLEIAKHVLEVSEADAADFLKENNRLEQLLNLKRGGGNTVQAVTNGNAFAVNGTATPATTNSLMNNATRMSNPNISSMTSSGVVNPATLMKTSQSVNSLKASAATATAAPKDNYDVFKDEISKMQQKTSQSQPTSPVNVAATTGGAATADVSWSNAFGDQPTNGAAQQDLFKNNDPFASFTANGSQATTSSAAAAAQPDPFGAAAFPTMKTSTTSNFDDLWSSGAAAVKTEAAVDPFSAPTVAADPFGGSLPTSKSIGFGQDDDNWATALNSTNTSASNNWAAFGDEGNAVKGAIDFFNSAQTTPKPAANYSALASLAAPSLIKYKALFAFDATREDELNLREGDIVNVDLSMKADEGWLFGECRGRSGVFPAGFTAKLSDLGAIQEESVMSTSGAFDSQFNNTSFQQETSLFAQQIQPQQPNPMISTIQNYFISLFAYVSAEPGDLNFREFEIINVIDKNEDWLTGQVVGSGTSLANPLRSGIFPSNFVSKFSLPLEYIGKYAIGLASEVYVPSETSQLMLDPTETQIIAIKKHAPDGKWSFGETYDINNVMKRGWFPTQSVTVIIESTVPPIVSASNTAASSPSSAILNHSISFNSSLNNTSGNSTTLALAESSAAPIIQPAAVTSATPASVGTKPPILSKKTAAAASSVHSPTSPPTAAKAASPVAVSQSNSSDNIGQSTKTTAVPIPTSTSTSTATATPANKRPSVSGSKGSLVNSATTTPTAAAPPSAIGANTNTTGTVSNSNSLSSLNSELKNRLKSISNDGIAAAHTPSSATVIASPTEASTPVVAAAAVATETASAPAASSTLPANVIDQVVALYDFQATTKETIGFPKDAVINILEKSGEWWLGEYQGNIGLLPYNYVQSLGTVKPANR